MLNPCLLALEQQSEMHSGMHIHYWVWVRYTYKVMHACTYMMLLYVSVHLCLYIIILGVMCEVHVLLIDYCHHYVRG